MKQEVGIGMDGLAAQPRQAGPVQQNGTAWLGMKRGHMAKMTFRLIEVPFSPFHLLVVHVTARWHTEALHVEVYILHIFRRHLQLGIGEPHHAALTHLHLSFADLFGIAAVSDTHIAGETEFYGQVGMLRLVAGQSQLRTPRSVI